MDLTWMAWTWQTAAFFGVILLLLCGMTVWEWARARAAARATACSASTRRAATGCSFRCSAAPTSISPGWAFIGPNLWWALALSIVYAIGGFPVGLEGPKNRCGSRPALPATCRHVIARETHPKAEEDTMRTAISLTYQATAQLSLLLRPCRLRPMPAAWTTAKALPSDNESRQPSTLSTAPPS